MMQSKFDRILEDCLDRMDRGEHLNQILESYPGLKDKLESLVLVAMLGRALRPPVPSYTALRLGKNDLLAEMAMMESEKAFLEPAVQDPPRRPLLDRWGESLGRLQPAYRLAMLSVVVIMAGGFFTLSASASEITDRVIQSIFLGFDQVGEMFWDPPDQAHGVGDINIFKGPPGFPDQPTGIAGYKTSLLETEGKDPTSSPGGQEQGSLNFVPTPFDFEDEDLDLDLDEDIDDEFEKDEEEDLKDEEKDLKEEEKEEDKEEKEDEKEEKEDEKEEDKEEKEDEKEDKEEEKEADKAEKDKDKLDKKDK